ncbi:hypothetical protein MKW94_000851 [Papaver nudicaule]|uniref:Uncharacterized protein n=1 Tax=Papaver nudicaule TaxID=74823 RepID=A0AA41RK40_PAPNU|nr:hypothetical protein [Papaver nudicaule]
MENIRCLRSDTAKQRESLVQGGFCEGGNRGEKLSDVKYTASLDRALDNDQKPGKKMKLGSDSRKRGNGAMDVVEEMIKGEELNPPCSNAVERKVVVYQTGLLARTQNASFPEIEKKKIFIVRCPQINGKMSESCIQEDGDKQDIHLPEGHEGDRVCERVTEESCTALQPARIIDNAKSHLYASGQSIMSGQKELQGEIIGIPQRQHSPSKQQALASEEANLSRNSEFVCTKEQTSDSEEANGSPSTNICKNVTLVKMIYSKRKEKLLANNSKKSIQFKEARDIIEKESIANLRAEHLHKSALVRKMHSEVDVRINKLPSVDKEFGMKVEIIKNDLNAEQEKLDSIHKAVRKEEEELKYHCLQEAKCGRSVDAFLVLPLFLDSCFNLDGLKRASDVHLDDPLLQVEQFEMSTTANSPSEPFLSNSSTDDTSVLLHAMQLESLTHMDSLSELVKSNQSEDEPSEPGSGTSVPENSLLCQQVREENHDQFVKFDENMEIIRRVDRAQPVRFREELKVCINTDFEKDLMEEIRENCSKSIHDANTALFLIVGEHMTSIPFAV